MVQNLLTIISGPPGAGKSTAALGFASKHAKSILISGDDLYNMVKGGHCKPWESDGASLMKLMYKAAASQAQIYIEAGFHVFVDYVFESADLKNFLSAFKDPQLSVRLVFLIPDEAILVSRDSNRRFSVGKERAVFYLQRFKELCKQWPEHVLDNSSSNAHLDIARVPVMSLQALKSLIPQF